MSFGINGLAITTRGRLTGNLNYGDPLATVLSGYAAGTAGAALWFLYALAKYKREIKKVGSTWYVIAYDNATPPNQIVNKPLKDVNGNDITDLAAGILAQEIASSV